MLNGWAQERLSSDAAAERKRRNHGVDQMDLDGLDDLWYIRGKSAASKNFGANTAQ